jgi:hypothetical protein
MLCRRSKQLRVSEALQRLRLAVKLGSMGSSSLASACAADSNVDRVCRCCKVAVAARLGREVVTFRGRA